MKKHEILTRESCKFEHKLFKNSGGGSRWGHIFGSKITHNEQNETTTSPPEYETIAMWNFDTFPRASGIRRAFSIARRNKFLHGTISEKVHCKKW